MPTYPYVCGRCGHRFDLFQRMSDPPVGTCPKCSNPHAERMISAPGFILKGAGFYVNDYRNGSASEKKAASEKAEKKDKK